MSALIIPRIEVRDKFCFRTVTLKELYDAIDSVDNNKSSGPGSGFFNAWARKATKCAIGTHLQFVSNTCISLIIFPENLKLAFKSPVYKIGDVKTFENYRLISITVMSAKFFELKNSISLTNLYEKL